MSRFTRSDGEILPSALDRAKMLRVLRTGTCRSTSTFRKNTLKDLKWRQMFAGKDIYELELRNGDLLKFCQFSKSADLEKLGTGTTVWPAAHALARYLEKSWGKNGKSRRRVMELGAGTGAAGICCAKLGAENVALTDLPEILELSKKNAALNDVHNVSVFSLDWSKPWLIPEEWKDPDVILVSECVLPQLYPLEPLADVVAALLKESHEAVALVAYEHRAFPFFDPRVKFPELLTERGLEVALLPPEDLDEDYSSDDIFIWRVTTSKQKPVNNKKTTLVCGDTWSESARHFQLLLPHEETISLKLDVSPAASVASALWPSSIVAARILLAMEKKPLRHVLELGAGCGLVAIALATASKHVTVHATDVNVKVLRDDVTKARPNFKGTVAVTQHAWGTPLHVDTIKNLDVVLCSDCAYDSTAVPALVRSLDALFHQNNKRPALLVVNEHRTALDILLRALRPRFPNLTNRHLTEDSWHIDCLPPHQQPPPIAAFYDPGDDLGVHEKTT